MKHLFILAFLLSASISQAANLGLTASSLKIKVYKFAVSTSPLCTNLKTIIDNGASPSQVEFIGGSGLGSGAIDNGTYPCIVIEMDSVIAYEPSATSDTGSCQLGVQSTLNVCTSGTSPLVDGSTTTCTGGHNRVAMYLSTASSGNSNPWQPPTTIGDTSHGFNLGAALTVSGATAGKFVVNPAGKVCDYSQSGCDGQGSTTGSASSCHLEPPTFSFAE